MAIGDDKVRLQVVVDRNTAGEIQKLAEAMGTSVSHMAARLLIAGIDDHAWLIKHVHAPVQRVLDKLRKRKSSDRS